jgi:transposase
MRIIQIALTEEQRTELMDLARHDNRPHVRLKAQAVLAVGQGKTRSLVAQVLGVERRAVGRWVQNYLALGATSFGIKKGRGRKAQVQAEEIDKYLRQPPSQFGIPRTRWTLGSLKEVTPCLMGMSESGVWRALSRLGYRYKRGQPVVHSPDPAYEEKRGLYCRL